MILIFTIIALFVFLLDRLNHSSVVLEEKDGIKIIYYCLNFPPHGQKAHNVLFYKGRKICSDVDSDEPNRYLRSPDTNLIIYAHRMGGKGYRYEIYDIKADKITVFPAEGWLAFFNGKVEWLSDKITLHSSDGKQTDILDLNNKTIKVVK